MMGDNTCWLPGYDHAGLATQIKVEEELKKKEGLTRYDLGREEFVKRVWKWKEAYGDEIVRQLKSLGISCDWDRQRFTMDEGLSRAVREAFVSLYEKGLIYKGTRMINWCVNCRTLCPTWKWNTRMMQGPVVHQLPHRGRKGPVSDHCHQPSGNHPRGYGRGRESQG